MEFTHLDAYGRARMVDVTEKPDTVRRAVAYGEIHAEPETLRKIAQQELAKGDVLTVAKLAGIGGAKRTGELIPLCHPIPLSHVDVEMALNVEQGIIRIQATAVATGKTGVEMEALTAVTVAGLTIYDMCKAVDRTMMITSVCLVQKQGGQRGMFLRPGWDPSRDLAEQHVFHS